MEKKKKSNYSIQKFFRRKKRNKTTVSEITIYNNDLFLWRFQVRNRLIWFLTEGLIVFYFYLEGFHYGQSYWYDLLPPLELDWKFIADINNIILKIIYNPMVRFLCFVYYRLCHIYEWRLGQYKGFNAIKYGPYDFYSMLYIKCRIWHSSNE